MDVAGIMREERKLPHDPLVALAEQMDEEVAQVGDLRFEGIIMSGQFDKFAAQALLEDRSRHQLS